MPKVAHFHAIGYSRLSPAQLKEVKRQLQPRVRPAQAQLRAGYDFVLPTLEDCQRNAQSLELPPILSLDEAGARVFCLPEHPQRSNNVRRRLIRAGLGGRLLGGARLLVRSGDALYALALERSRRRGYVNHDENAE
jgi:hypothetical protein